MNTVAIVVAAGRGERIGFKKQFAMLCGRPVWARSCDALLNAGISKIWMSVPEEDLPNLAADSVVMSYGASLALVAGGNSRFASVRNAMMTCVSSLDDGAELSDVLIAVHDAARPFVSVEDVQAVIESAEAHGAAMLGQPCADTVKRVASGVVEATVPRLNLWLAQTPQVFRMDWMSHLYLNTPVDEQAITDDASLFEQAGFGVQMVKAAGINFKITGTHDWALAQWLAAQRFGGN